MKLFVSFLMVVLFAASAVAADDKAAAKVAKPDLAKGEASFTAVCAACHGADGNSMIPANPKLAQQHPEYTLKQLKEFKSGKRANAIMSGMVAALSEDDMKNIAFWLAS
jgi:cytochrome c553